MKLTKCEQCGGPTAEGLPLCPDCMRATGAAADQIAAAEELRDIARVLSITANTDANIREAIVGILNIAERLERGKWNFCNSCFQVFGFGWAVWS